MKLMAIEEHSRVDNHEDFKNTEFKRETEYSEVDFLLPLTPLNKEGIHYPWISKKITKREILIDQNIKGTIRNFLSTSDLSVSKLAIPLIYWIIKLFNNFGN